MKKTFIVELITEELSKLKAMIRKDEGPAHERQHAQMLLRVDEGPCGPGWEYADISKAFDYHNKY